MLEIWMSLVGVSMSFASVPQGYRIWKRKQSDDLSIAWFVIILHGLFWWLYYGIKVGSISLIITNTVCIIVDLIVLFLIIKYRSPRVKTQVVLEQRVLDELRKIFGLPKTMADEEISNKTRKTLLVARLKLRFALSDLWEDILEQLPKQLLKKLSHYNNKK